MAAGDDREDLAAAVAAQVAAIWAAAEAAILAALAQAVRRALPLASATTAGTARLRREAAGILARAEQRTRLAVERAGIPWDYAPVLPAPQRAAPPGVPPASAAAAPDAGPPGGLAPGGPPPPEPAPLPAAARAAGIPDTLAPADTAAAAREAGAATGPSVRDLIGRTSSRVYRDLPDAYHDAVREAIEATRGGMPQSSLSLSRIQAAQKALDRLAGRGITGFTDRAGREWDLLAYVEMATRTAVSNAWDNLLGAAMIRSGQDLVFTITGSTEGSCPLCLPWLGRVLSLTGMTTGRAPITDAAGRAAGMEVSGTIAEARAAGFRHPGCRCGWISWANGADVVAATRDAEPEARSAETYKASQVQRGYERAIRRAGREEAAALSPQARTRARRAGTELRRMSARHREETGLRMTRAGVRRREHPHHAH